VAQAFVHRLRVRYAECDLQGVVFNANYMTYLDEAMTELWRRHVDGGYQEMVAAGADMVVAEAQLRFRAPARFDDELAIEARTTRLGTTGMTTALRVTRDGDTLLEAELRHVFVAADGSGKVPIPDAVRRGLEPLMRAGEQAA
jgi:acyl-CoA thioester hydrolase